MLNSPDVLRRHLCVCACFIDGSIQKINGHSLVERPGPKAKTRRRCTMCYLSLRQKMSSKDASRACSPRDAWSRTGPGRGEAGPSWRRYPCSTCGKVYSHNESLIRHVRFECGKFPQFKCPHCPHRTAQRSNLMRHMKRFHGPYQPD
ncbi:hypothetical protein ONE63_006223 [Megalurothrips usitatus]|uniref:C2H2-type domain-containing protein n=1 Tax=Megalurothrips usitatus TaxID=439358 RepID=A0AAV7XTR6_9NEOP|nr:hypothetical protein ONE63_006223 [Megalurothrips usitatus]